MKKKMYILIIITILFTGVGIYAANKYDSKDFSYTKEDESSITVGDALNELYKKHQYISQNQCPINALCTKAKVGDYVSMTPTETTYTIYKSLTGYSKDQTINPSELNLWRIIKINENGTIEMVSEYVSNKKVYFKGKTGYLNSVGVLNEIASQYGNSKYTIGSRIMGYNGQTETITNATKIKSTAPWKYNTKNNNNETLGGGDMMYQDDTNLVKEVLGTLVAKNPSGTVVNYVLGSRNYDYYSSTKFSFCLRYVVGTTGKTSSYGLYDYDDGVTNSSRSSAIRPIVTLKSDVYVTGSGTSDDPYVLE